eukprot:scaffold2943_cov60-Phaeocystis_antarctica.AAC.3
MGKRCAGRGRYSYAIVRGGSRLVLCRPLVRCGLVGGCLLLRCLLGLARGLLPARRELVSLLLTTHCSLLTTHHSPLATHHSLLTRLGTHYSPTHCSSHHSPPWRRRAATPQRRRRARRGRRRSAGAAAPPAPPPPCAWCACARQACSASREAPAASMPARQLPVAPGRAPRLRPPRLWRWWRPPLPPPPPPPRPAPPPAQARPGAAHASDACRPTWRPGPGRLGPGRRLPPWPWCWRQPWASSPPPAWVVPPRRRAAAARPPLALRLECASPRRTPRRALTLAPRRPWARRRGACGARARCRSAR